MAIDLGNDAELRLETFTQEHVRAPTVPHGTASNTLQSLWSKAGGLGAGILEGAEGLQAYAYMLPPARMGLDQRGPL